MTDTTADDLKKRIKLLEKALRLNEQKYQIGALASGLVHGFKNDLMLLIGNLEYMKMISSDENIKGFIENAMEAANRINDKTTNILQYSRNIKAEKAKTNICSLLDSQVALYGNGKSHWIFLKKYGNKKINSVYCNPHAISYAVGTILENATEASPQFSKIDVDVDQSSAMTSIRIKDSGKGIPEDVKKRIFDIGYTHGKENGNGIGLAFSKEYLKDNGCDLRFNSKEGKGTTFYIDIPQENSSK
jgi:signal transduction histidine kinase